VFSKEFDLIQREPIKIITANGIKWLKLCLILKWIETILLKKNHLPERFVAGGEVVIVVVEVVATVIPVVEFDAAVTCDELGVVSEIKEIITLKNIFEGERRVVNNEPCV
jgi:hypothetical protein